jgi:hypothetical protein
MQLPVGVVKCSHIIPDLQRLLAPLNVLALDDAIDVGPTRCFSQLRRPFYSLSGFKFAGKAVIKSNVSLFPARCKSIKLLKFCTY